MKESRESGDEISLRVLGLIGSCGFDALQVRGKKDEVHYRRLHRFAQDCGRAVPIVCSDAHSASAAFDCDGETPFLKISKCNTPAEVFEEIRDKGLRFGETRFAYTSPGSVRSWIAEVEICPDAGDAAHFWPFAPGVGCTGATSFATPFSRNLNCLIGGRGSGKSALIEAIDFVLQPTEFEMARKKMEDRPDWYKIAHATLGGCFVRVWWQFQGRKPTGTWQEPVYATRYFDASGEHLPVKWLNSDDSEMSQAARPTECEVQLFRVHDIESAAEPQKLRRLFDQICGPRIVRLEDEIRAILDELQKSRESLVAVASQIRELTTDGAALREYVRRNIEYDAVNKPEVQGKYQAVDQSGAAVTTAKSAQSSWAALESKLPLETLAQELTTFVDTTAASSLDLATGQPKPYCGPILSALRLARTPEGSVESGLIAEVGKAMDSLATSLKKVQEGLEAAVNESEEAHKVAREELARAGLPPGSGERAVKKKAFEEAEAALARYRELLEQWETLLQDRLTLFNSLKEKCAERTELRRETAESLTGQLRKDLDDSILIIELDAQPLADRAQLAKWLQANLGPSVPRNRQKRLDALLKKGILPAELRDLFLASPDSSAQVLTVAASSAAEGRITTDEAETYAGACVAIARLTPEDAISELAQEKIAALPQEIRAGLQGFVPTASDERELKVDAVLRLDEVILDDMPEIRLNDRPQDKGSKQRPLSELSPGQRCSAILPILLLNGTGPLLIDQPEDNLDNRLIRQVIVNILAAMKMRRQVIVATHNPNLPVLGDVEQAIILRAVEEKACAVEARGNLDEGSVVKYITDIMEGGREAFQYRHSIYASHWRGPVDSDGE